ncbi:hypothetical protein IQ247_28365 [Plectonema cf. radiosum LEGE 06105]|uniref:Uncharacterized protein n=1 Tax=Plectonema cf. radiosum LEGE 06105 TaxID=945769 RepID=A0A8J7F819_9CYAN|nr:hypothetical protein [Plectonema radiosum]MBE9216528.1 hypothetical protein [Plectonema cf. radiosum LEGE 06105]
MNHYDQLQLDLLVPWDLPIDEQLNEADTVKLSQALSQILKALKQVDAFSAVVIIKNALSNLDSPNVFPAKISSTKLALKSWEIQDFDRHFDVNHVETQQPALCIAKSLMLAVYRMFVLLNEQNNHFDSLAVERQKTGYISYIRLLSRVYNLRLEESQ